MRDIRFGINEYPDVVDYYAANVVNGNTLSKDAQALGRFNVNDIGGFAWRPIVINGNLTSNLEYVGKVETIDPISNLRPQMFVKYRKGDQLFIVVDITEMEISDKMVSARPSYKRIISLRGVKK